MPATSGAAGQSAEEYIDRHRVAVYLQDALALLLAAKPDAPLEFLADYYRRVRRGEHVAHRSFAYVNATHRNRRSFIRLFSITFGDVEAAAAAAAAAEKSDEVSGGGHRGALPPALTFADFLALQRLLCPDFPAHFCEDAAKCLTTGGALGHVLPLGRFLPLFRLLFYYAEFLGLVRDTGPNPKSETITPC